VIYHSLGESTTNKIIKAKMNDEHIVKEVLLETYVIVLDMMFYP